MDDGSKRALPWHYDSPVTLSPSSICFCAHWPLTTKTGSKLLEIASSGGFNYIKNGLSSLILKARSSTACFYRDWSWIAHVEFRFCTFLSLCSSVVPHPSIHYRATYPLQNTLKLTLILFSPTWDIWRKLISSEVHGFVLERNYWIFGTHENLSGLHRLLKLQKGSSHIIALPDWDLLFLFCIIVHLSWIRRRILVTFNLCTYWKKNLWIMNLTLVAVV